MACVRPGKQWDHKPIFMLGIALVMVTAGCNHPHASSLPTAGEGEVDPGTRVRPRAHYRARKSGFSDSQCTSRHGRDRGARHPEDAVGRYVRRHVPLLSFTAIQQTPDRCARVVDAKTFDPHQLPHYAFYSPDLDNDGHDGPQEKRLDTAAHWLQQFLEKLPDRGIMPRTLIVVTFDESKSYLHNHIYTVFLGGMVRRQYKEPRRYDHYNVLRTIEENFALGTLGAEDATASPITHVWEPPKQAGAQ